MVDQTNKWYLTCFSACRKGFRLSTTEKWSFAEIRVVNHWVLFHLWNSTYCAWIRISYHLRPNPLCQHGLVQSLVAVLWLGRLGGKAIMTNKSTCWQLVGALHCWSAFGSWGQWRSSSPCPSELPTCPRGSQCCGTGCPWSTKKGRWKRKGGRRPFHNFLCNQKLLRGGDIYHKSIWVCTVQPLVKQGCTRKCFQNSEYWQCYNPFLPASDWRMILTS